MVVGADKTLSAKSSRHGRLPQVLQLPALQTGDCITPALSQCNSNSCTHGHMQGILVV